MPEVQAELVIGINQTQTNLKITVQMMTDVDKAVKKTSADSKASFTQVGNSVKQVNNDLGKSIGIIAQLRSRIAGLKDQREIATTAQEVNKLTEEIKKSELEVRQLEGTLDAFGKRQGRGLNELTNNFFALGQGLIGVTNLIGILGDKGEKENQALIAATRLLVIAESARAVVVGFLKAQELAALLVSRLQASANITQAATNKAVTTTIEEQALAYLELAGAKRSDVINSQAAAGANVELAGATNTATSASNKLNLSLLANPYVLIAAGILAIVGAMILFGDESGKVTDQIIEDQEKQLELQNSLASSRQRALDAELAYLKAIGAIRESEAQRRAELQRFADDEKRIKSEKNIELLKQEKDFQDKSKGLRFAGLLDAALGGLSDRPLINPTPVIGPSEEEQSRHNKAIADITAKFNTQIESLQTSHQFALLQIDRAGKQEVIAEDNKLNQLRIAVIRNELERSIQARQQSSKEEIAALIPLETNKAEKIRLINEKAAQDILVIRQKAARDAVDILIKQAEAERALHQRILTQQAELGTNQEKLLADQAKARADLQAELERTLLARERDIQDQAAKKGFGATDPSVLKQINDEKLKINAEFQKLFSLQNIVFGISQTQLERNDAQSRLNLLQDSLEKRLQAFDLAAATEKESLIKNGADEAAIDAANFRKRNEVIRDFQIERINQIAKMNNDILEATIDTEKLTNEEIKKIRLEQLREDRDAAIEKLELIKFIAEASGDTTDATKAKIAELDAFIQQIKNKINTAKKEITPINWADIFGIPDEFKDQFNAAIEDLFTTGMEIWSQAIANEIAANEELIQSNQEVIDSLNQRISETEAALKDEEELFRQGFASNVDIKRRELAALKAEREKELQDQKKLMQERIKLAKEQQLIDSISQASSIVTSGANLIKTWSTLPFGVGLALAFAQIATIISFIGSLRSKAAQAATGGGFKEGGYTGDGINTEVAGDVHRREFVFTEEKTKEYRSIFEKMHRDQPLNSGDLAKLLEGTGVAIPEAEKKSIMNNDIHIRDQEEKNKAEDGSMMIKKMNQFIEKAEAIQKEIKDRPVIYYDPDGATVIIRGNEKKTIRKAP